MTLKGVTTVCVGVLITTADFISSGLDSAALRISVEQSVRTAGLRVVSCDVAEERKTSQGDFVVIARAMRDSVSRTWWLAVQSMFFQRVLLARSGDHAWTATWIRVHLISVGPSNLNADVQKSVQPMVSMFLKDWLSVNSSGT